MCIRDSSPFISHQLLHTLSLNNIPVTFIWVPGHKGIAGNDKADKAAKEATRLPSLSPKVLPTNSDLFHFIRHFINQAWLTVWQKQNPYNKLSRIKKTTSPWPSSNLLNRRDEIVLTRLRIGHTRLTHTHLVSDHATLTCPHCHIDLPLTVEHFFSCFALNSLRNSYRIPHCHISALSNNSESLYNIFPFLHEAGFLSKI